MVRFGGAGWVLGAFLTLAVLAGCSDEELDRFQKSAQKALSPMGSQERTLVRKVVGQFNGGNPANVNILELIEVIADEARRYFVDIYTAGEVVVLDRELDLTSDAVLPKLDMYGRYDPTGGYIEFVETTHNAAGDLTSEKAVHKAVRQFTKGAISAYSFFRTQDSSNKDSVRESLVQSYDVASEVEFVGTGWHQQVESVTTSGGFGGDVTFSEVYKYQSQPWIRFTLRAGDQARTEHRLWDSILGTKGWDLAEKEEGTYSIHGKLTLYAPVEDGVEENKAAKKNPDTQTEDLGNRTKTVTTQTTVNEAANPVNGYLVAKEKVTWSLEEISTVEKGTGRQMSAQTTEHESRVVTYEVIPGKENEAYRARWFETFVDHVETTKVVVKSDVTYGTGNDQTEERSVTEFRYTDNPATRNNLWDWRSTSQQWTIRSYMDTVTNQWTVRTEDKGLVWLVDRYKPDPTYNDVAFGFEGSFSDLEEETHRFFGDDASGLKSNVKGTHVRDYVAGFGGDGVTVSGTYHSSNAQVNNADGGVHGNAAAVDGTLKVTVGGVTHDVSAEEWTLEVEP